MGPVLGGIDEIQNGSNPTTVEERMGRRRTTSVALGALIALAMPLSGQDHPQTIGQWEWGNDRTSASVALKPDGSISESIHPDLRAALE